MKPKMFAFAAMLLVSGTTDAWAENACLIEGRVYNEAVKDCSQTSMPIPAAAFAAQCKSNAQGPLKATPLKACPAKAQAMCVNPYGQKVTVYYYSRGPRSLADTKTSCLAQKGKWIDKP